MQVPDARNKGGCGEHDERRLGALIDGLAPGDRRGAA
jgi:hypothetical protein